MTDKRIIIKVREGSETDFEDGYSHVDLLKAISLARQEERKRILKVIDKYDFFESNEGQTLLTQDYDEDEVIDIIKKEIKDRITGEEVK